MTALTGYRVILGLKLREIVRTWRIWVLPGIVLFFALTGPPTARYTKELLTSMLGDQAGLVPIPDPTYVDAYLQWTKNLSQLVIAALIVALGGIVNAETRSGTGILLFTKPVSRTAFLLASGTATTLFVALTSALGAILTWGLTRMLFPTAPPGGLIAATACWLIFAILIVAIMMLASAATDAAAGASGIGLAVFLALAIASAWGPAARYSPAGLLGAPDALARGIDVPLTWPLVTSMVGTVVTVVLADLALRRREL